jgi:N12 class adenine-specific DNA methylase
LEGKLYSGPREEGQFTLKPTPGLDLAAAMAKATEKFPKDLYQGEVKAETERLEHFDDTAVPQDVPVGSFFIDKDGRIQVRGKDANGLRTATPLVTRYANDPVIVGKLIEIRDVMRKLSALERDASSTPEAIEALRKELNAKYDAFVKQHGILNRISNRRVFSDDPLSPRVFALEKDIDPGVSKAKAKEDGIPAKEPSAAKADIFTKRVMFPVQEITSASDAKSGLALSLNQRGHVDINYIASLTGLEPDQITKELKGVIFLTPNGSWQTAVDYLSGNVKEKLALAKKAAETNSQFEENVQALEKVIPKDIPAADIKIRLGAPWVGEATVDQFIRDLTGIAPELVFYSVATGKSRRYLRSGAIGYSRTNPVASVWFRRTTTRSTRTSILSSTAAT